MTTWATCSSPLPPAPDPHSTVSMSSLHPLHRAQPMHTPVFGEYVRSRWRTESQIKVQVLKWLGWVGQGTFPHSRKVGALGDEQREDVNLWALLRFPVTPRPSSLLCRRTRHVFPFYPLCPDPHDERWDEMPPCRAGKRRQQLWPSLQRGNEDSFPLYPFCHVCSSPSALLYDYGWNGLP